MSNPNNRDSNMPVNHNDRIADESAYRAGYREGRNSQILMEEERESYVTPDNRTPTSGITMSLALALITGAAIVGGIVYFLNQQVGGVRDTAPATQIVPVPVPERNESPAPTKQQDTTIIDRTIEKTKEVVPVPQPSSPESSDRDSSTSTPNVNINLPPVQQQETETQTSPAQTENNQEQPESSNSEQ